MTGGLYKDRRLDHGLFKDRRSFFFQKKKNFLSSDFGLRNITSDIKTHFFLGCLNFSDTLVLKEHEAHEALWIFGTSMLEEHQAP
ncbi:unnamed protein product [Rhizophagus irregularis]|nr:unnamed protein product [Rhizophagus irregularis]